MILGAQFYTLREHCKTVEDFAESLKKVADIGYTVVQISGTCAYEPQWLAEQLKENGLKCVITHTPFDRMRDDTAAVIAEHEVFGCDHIGLGIGPNMMQAPQDVQAVLDLAHTAGAQMAKAGKHLMYHNHHGEFQRHYTAADGTPITMLEYLMEQTAPEELGFTMDTYWVQMGGADVVQTIGKFAGRIPCVHLKDMAIAPDKDGKWYEQRMAPVGSGNLNWEAILPAFELAGAEYALVEQDMCYGEDPFACLKKSYDFLTAMGLK